MRKINTLWQCWRAGNKASYSVQNEECMISKQLFWQHDLKRVGDSHLVYVVVLPNIHPRNEKTLEKGRLEFKVLLVTGNALTCIFLLWKWECRKCVFTFTWILSSYVGKLYFKLNLNKELEELVEFHNEEEKEEKWSRASKVDTTEICQCVSNCTDFEDKGMNTVYGQNTALKSVWSTGHPGIINSAVTLW